MLTSFRSSKLLLSFISLFFSGVCYSKISRNIRPYTQQRSGDDPVLFRLLAFFLLKLDKPHNPIGIIASLAIDEIVDYAIVHNYIATLYDIGLSPPRLVPADMTV